MPASPTLVKGRASPHLIHNLNEGFLNVPNSYSRRGCPSRFVWSMGGPLPFCQLPLHLHPSIIFHIGLRFGTFLLQFDTRSLTRRFRKVSDNNNLKLWNKKHLGGRGFTTCTIATWGRAGAHSKPLPTMYNNLLHNRVTPLCTIVRWDCQGICIKATVLSAHLVHDLLAPAFPLESFAIHTYPCLPSGILAFLLDLFLLVRGFCFLLTILSVLCFCNIRLTFILP